MTQKDLQLIEEAKKLSYIDWYAVSKMEDEAETQQAKEILHSITMRLYHLEEAACGCL